MLVLARKKNESIVISDNITVTVLEIRDKDGKTVEGGKVRLGIESPRNVSVYQQEVYKQIHGKSSEKPS